MGWHRVVRTRMGRPNPTNHRLHRGNQLTADGFARRIARTIVLLLAYLHFVGSFVVANDPHWCKSFRPEHLQLHY